MRKPLNKFLENWGYRIEKISRFSVLLDRLYWNTPGFKFIQVGANDGISFDGLYHFVTSHCCSGLVIEPLPDVFETLRLNYLHHPRIVPVNVALHSDRATATLYRIAPDKIGSLDKPWTAGIASFSPDHARKLGFPPEFIVEEQVPCAPLMDILVRYGALDAQLLQVDTEGYDAEIIKMIDFSRFRPALIKYERINLSAAVQAETQDRLIRAGYQMTQDGADTIAALKQPV
jgi:FkbM family methyltransferase